MSNLKTRTIFGGLTNPFASAFEAENSFMNYFDKFLLDLPTSVKTNYGENENEFFVHLQVPGFSKEDLKINFENESLTISADVEKTTENNSDSFHRKDFEKTSFKKSFYLPKNVIKNEIEAELKNGVLNIVIPKQKIEKLPEKKIEIAVK